MIRTKRGQEGVSVGGALGAIILILAVVVILLVVLGFVFGYGWSFWEMFTGGTVNVGAVIQACKTQCEYVAQGSEAQAINVYCNNLQSVVFLDSDGEINKKDLKDKTCYDLIQDDKFNLGFAELKTGVCKDLHVKCPQAQVNFECVNEADSCCDDVNDPVTLPSPREVCQSKKGCRWVAPTESAPTGCLAKTDGCKDLPQTDCTTDNCCKWQEK